MPGWALGFVCFSASGYKLGVSAILHKYFNSAYLTAGISSLHGFHLYVVIPSACLLSLFQHHSQHYSSEHYRRHQTGKHFAACRQPSLQKSKKKKS